MSDTGNTIEFSCACGKQFRAREDQGGRSYTCPSCGDSIRVPTTTVHAATVFVASDSSKSIAGRSLAMWRSRRAPQNFGEMLLYLLGTWALIGIICLIASFFSIYAKIVALLFFLVATGAAVDQLWKLLRARQRVLVDKDVSLLWGFVRLIAWDPIEGVLILQNKNVGFSDDNLQDGRGGVRFMYPILGEELALRVPLEVQTLRFRDENVMTREYLSVTISGTMKWRIVNIQKFYLLVSRELRSTTDHNDRVIISPSTRPVSSGDPAGGGTISRLLIAAIEWIRILVEEQTRIVVSRSNSGLLIADRLSQEFGVSNASLSDATHAGAANHGPKAGEWGGAADGLAGLIHDTIAKRLEAFGIAVTDVSLQEIKLPDEVLQECIKAAKAYYYPLLAHRQASFKGADLQAQADVLGREALATREIVHAAPAFGVADFVSKFLNQRLPSAAGTNVAMAIAAQAALLPTPTIPVREES